MFKSSDRTTGTVTNMTLTLSEPIPRIRSVQLTAVTIPCTYYYINKGNAYLGTNSSSLTVQITPGTYTPATLATAVQSAINTALSITSTVTWNSVTKKYTITHSSGAESIYIDASLGLGPIMGFDSNTTITTGNSDTSDFQVTFTNINIVGDATIFNLSNGVTDYPITVTEKNYTASSLSAELQAKINATSGLSGFTVTFSRNTLKYTITSGGGFGNPVIGTNANNILASIMGFVDGDTGSSNVLVSTYKTTEDLNFSHFYLSSNYLLGNQKFGNVLKSLGEEKLIKIPIKVIPGEILTFIPERRINIIFGEPNGLTLSEIDFKLYFADEFNVRPAFIAYLHGWQWSVKVILERT